MNTKSVLGIIVVIVVAAGVVWFTKTPAASQEATSIDTTESATSTSAAAGKRVFTWNLTDMGTDPSDVSRSRTGISLTTGGKTYKLGEFNGSCNEIDGQSSWQLYEGEKTGVVCWFGGGGTEYGVFEENGKVVVKQGDLDEGNAEIAGTRGNFKTILTLD